MSNEHHRTFAEKTLDKIEWRVGHLETVKRAMDKCANERNDPPPWKIWESYLADALNERKADLTVPQLIDPNDKPATKEQLDEFFVKLRKISKRKKEPFVRPKRTAEEQQKHEADLMAVEADLAKTRERKKPGGDLYDSPANLERNHDEVQDMDGGAGET